MLGDSWHCARGTGSECRFQPEVTQTRKGVAPWRNTLPRNSFGQLTSVIGAVYESIAAYKNIDARTPIMRGGLKKRKLRFGVLIKLVMYVMLVMLLTNASIRMSPSGRA